MKPRTKTLSPRQQKKAVAADLLLEPELVAAIDAERPRTRGECVGGVRPCPWVACRYHLLLDVTPYGGLVQLPGVELEQLKHSCALDVADAGDNTLEVVGELLAVTRERVRQIEAKAIERATSVVEGRAA